MQTRWKRGLSIKRVGAAKYIVGGSAKCGRDGEVAGRGARLQGYVAAGAVTPVLVITACRGHIAMPAPPLKAG